MAAVETTDEHQPRRINLRRVKRFGKKNIKAIAETFTTKASRVVTDGLGCFNGIKAAGREHESKRPMNHPSQSA